MSNHYSQVRAMLAITKGSLRAIFRSPSAVIFSFAFPLIFILVFGFIGNGGKVTVHVAFDKTTDTTTDIYRAIASLDGLVKINKPEAALRDDLSKGRIAAIIHIDHAATEAPAGSDFIKASADEARTSAKDEVSKPHISANASEHNTDTSAKASPAEALAKAGPVYFIKLTSSDAVAPSSVQYLRSMINGVITGMNKRIFPDNSTYAAIVNQVEQVPGRAYRTIDFVLPGQLGFSLLSAGVFGVAFIFFSLRQTLVLKRFFATPIKRSYILFGEALSRVIFQLTTAVVILLIGHFAFHFTLINGFETFIELLVLSFIGLAVFMGFGFVVSGLAKNESSIPPFANLFTLPQFLLAGTFFPIDNFPAWLQPLCRILPLTHLNDAMRNVAFEGAHLSDCGTQLAALGIWGVVTYAVAIKVFKWGD